MLWLIIMEFNPFILDMYCISITYPIVVFSMAINHHWSPMVIIGLNWAFPSKVYSMYHKKFGWRKLMGDIFIDSPCCGPSRFSVPSSAGRGSPALREAICLKMQQSYWQCPLGLGEIFKVIIMTRLACIQIFDFKAGLFSSTFWFERSFRSGNAILVFGPC